MNSRYSLPDVDLKPPRIHTLGLSIFAGASLSIIAIVMLIGNAAAPDVPAEYIKAARETEQTEAFFPSPSISPSPSATP